MSTPQLDLPDILTARAAVPSGLWLTLTAREQAFVAAKLANPSCSDKDAIIAAGAPARSAKTVGHEVAHRPHVKAALECARQASIAKAERSAEAVVTLLWDNAEDARKAGEYGTSTQAASVLAKVYGLLEKRVRLTVDNPDAALAQLKAMPKAERVKVLRELLGA